MLSDSAFKPKFLVLFVLFTLCSMLLFLYGHDVSKGKETILYVDRRDTSIFHNGHQEYIIKNEIDLKGACLLLPESISLRFDGGIIKNGAIVGNNTRLGSQSRIFDNVEILGSWIVPNISSDMFVSLDKVNDLINVFALASDSINNHIIITDGRYTVNATEQSPDILKVSSNTELTINGLIELSPNALERYAICYTENAKNIRINGTGEIRGDKHKHLAKTGEWGMGIKLMGSDDVEINGLHVSNAWGDCIYVGRGCKKIIISKCKLDEGRRQGISVIAGTNVVISDCYISNVYGTNPQYAIDIEPNHNDIVEHAIVQGVKVESCQGGLKVHGKVTKNDGYSVKKVYFKDNILNCNKRIPICFDHCEQMSVRSNIINSGSRTAAILYDECNNVDIHNNKVNYLVLNEIKKGN